MAPITNPERYEGSVDFWCDVYGIDSKLLYNPFKSFNMPCRCHQNLGGGFCMQYDDLKLFFCSVCSCATCQKIYIWRTLHWNNWWRECYKLAICGESWRGLQYQKCQTTIMFNCYSLLWLNSNCIRGIHFGPGAAHCVQVKHIDCYNFTVEEFKSITTKYKVSSMMLGELCDFNHNFLPVFWIFYVSFTVL